MRLMDLTDVGTKHIGAFVLLVLVLLIFSCLWVGESVMMIFCSKAWLCDRCAPSMEQTFWNTSAVTAALLRYSSALARHISATLVMMTSSVLQTFQSSSFLAAQQASFTCLTWWVLSELSWHYGSMFVKQPHLTNQPTFLHLPTPNIFSRGTQKKLKLNLKLILVQYSIFLPKFFQQCQAKHLYLQCNQPNFDSRIQYFQINKHMSLTYN